MRLKVLTIGYAHRRPWDQGVSSVRRGVHTHVDCADARPSRWLGSVEQMLDDDASRENRKA